MRKKLLFAVYLLLIVMLASGCMFMGVSSLQSMISENRNSETGTTVQTESDEDTVTISKELYERYRELDKMLYMMDVIDERCYYEADHQTMIEQACKGLLNGVDDVYTFYYTPEEFTQMWEDDEGKYAGVGMQITGNYVTGICTISRVFDGTPAKNAGVRKGDILYKVGEDLFVNASNLDEAVNIMRGEPDTAVTITLLRNGEELTLTMNRAEITVNYVDHMMLDDQIGLIQLYQFAGECDKEFAERLQMLVDDGAKGLIIDLRDNPGGWVDAAANICDLFCDEGEVCYLVHKDGQEEHLYFTRNGKTDIPIVILINENSASASEVMSGCLRDRADATLVGVTSYGKGIVQEVIYVDFDGSGMQYTISEYLTPNGVHIHGIGLTPDVEAELPEDDNGEYDIGDLNDPQLMKAIEVMKTKIQ